MVVAGMEDEVVSASPLKGAAPAVEEEEERSVVLSDDCVEVSTGRVPGGEEEEEEEEEVASGGFWSGRVRTRRYRGEIAVVDRVPVKRKHVHECSPVSDTESDEDASSSDSDASDGEYEQWSSGKRRRGGEHICGSVLVTDESLHDHELKEMQQLLELQLQASERREAGMKQRMESMMEMLSKHMGHMEKRVGKLEVGAQPHDQILERINVKLEKVMEGFSTLNENLSLLSACLSRDLDPHEMR